MNLIITLTLLVSLQLAPTPIDTLSLQYCYEQAYENYPAMKKIALQQKISKLNVKIAQSGYYPQISITGKATYQSEVTEFSLRGGGGPPGVSKDQYEAAVNITQTIFNGGAVGIREDLARAKSLQTISSIKVNLYEIRRQVNNVYYGILLSKQQQKTTFLVIENLQSQIAAIRSKVKHGALLTSQLYILQAELINARQDSIEIRSNIEAGYEVLGLLTGQEIPVSTELILPKVQVNYRLQQPQRPKYDLFRSSLTIVEKKQELQEAQKWPRLSAFGTAAYGRPGLNFLNDDFHDYYIVGIRLQWNLWGFINSDRKEQALEIQQQQIVQDRRSFTLQLNTELERIRERIAAIKEKIEKDKQIVELRKKIVAASASQLKYGVITASDYVSELTKLSRAKLSMFIHRIQLSQAKTEYATTLGVPLDNEINTVSNPDHINYE